MPIEKFQELETSATQEYLSDDPNYDAVINYFKQAQTENPGKARIYQNEIKGLQVEKERTAHVLANQPTFYPEENNKNIEQKLSLSENVKEAKYSPLATGIMRLSNARPNPLAEQIASNPGDFVLEKLGLPRGVDSGIESNPAIPATYPINYVSQNIRPIAGAALEAGVLGAATKIPKAARFLATEGIPELKSFALTGRSRGEYAAAQLTRRTDYLNKLKDAKIAARASVRERFTIPEREPFTFRELAARSAIDREF